jgi:RecJ-like exonuclease
MKGEFDHVITDEAKVILLNPNYTVNVETLLFHVAPTQREMAMPQQASGRCSMCKGSGTFAGKLCASCNGTGRCPHCKGSGNQNGPSSWPKSSCTMCAK